MDQDNLNRIIEMAWEDRTPFDVIYKEFDITQNDLERLMRNNLKPSSFKLWRKRVSGRKTTVSYTHLTLPTILLV